MKHDIEDILSNYCSHASSTMTVRMVIRLNSYMGSSEQDERKVQKAFWNLVSYDKFDLHGGILFPVIVKTQAGGAISDNQGNSTSMEDVIDLASSKKWKLVKVFTPWYTQQGNHAANITDVLYTIINRKFDISKWMRKAVDSEVKLGDDAPEYFLVLVYKGPVRTPTDLEVKSIVTDTYNEVENQL